MTDESTGHRPHLLGDTFGHGNGGHSTGLGDADRLAIRTLAFDLGFTDHAAILLETTTLVKERWDLGRLSRSSFGHYERHLVVGDGSAYLGLVFVDGQLLPCFDVRGMVCWCRVVHLPSDRTSNHGLNRGGSALQMQSPRSQFYLRS